MRDNLWLTTRLDNIWEMLFPDIERKNRVSIYFKGRWKNKFGHIKMLPDKSSEIVINSLFQDSRVPEGVIDATIAHELVHYMHGFQSPHKQRYKHPHAGGVVTRELKKRGFSHVLAEEREFLQYKWWNLYKEMTGKKKKSLFSKVFG